MTYIQKFLRTHNHISLPDVVLICGKRASGPLASILAAAENNEEDPEKVQCFLRQSRHGSFSVQQVLF